MKEVYAPGIDFQIEQIYRELPRIVSGPVFSVYQVRNVAVRNNCYGSLAGYLIGLL